MRPLLVKITALALACSLTMVWLALGPGAYDHELSILVNKRALLASTPSPKLVLIGGSGLLAGVDSGLVARELGVGVVNLGVYAGCGLDMLPEYIAPYVNEGDVVVLIPEYVQFGRALELNDAECRKWMLRSLVPRVPRALYNDAREALSDLAALAVSKVRGTLRANLFARMRMEDSGFFAYADNFDKYGDKLSGFPPASPLTGQVQLSFNKETIEANRRVLAKLSQSLGQRKARLRVLPQAAAESWFMRERSAIDALFAALDPKDVVGRPVDFVLDDSLFQDSVNHVGPTGRFIRTERLVQALRDDGTFSVRYGRRYSASGVISPARYDLTSGFHDDRVFTRGDARFYRLEYPIKAGERFLVVQTNGWNPYYKMPDRLGLRVFVDGTELVLSSRQGTAFWFDLPSKTATVQQIRLVSNVFRPADIGLNNDGRTLGIDVESVTFR